MKPFKKAHAPFEGDFFSIEEKNGIKQIHIKAFLYKNEENIWTLNEGNFPVIPLKEFYDGLKAEGDNYFDELFVKTEQISKTFANKQDATDCINTRFDGKAPEAEIPYRKLTPETPVGNYVYRYENLYRKAVLRVEGNRGKEHPILALVNGSKPVIEDYDGVPNIILHDLEGFDFAVHYNGTQFCLDNNVYEDCRLHFTVDEIRNAKFYPNPKIKGKGLYMELEENGKTSTFFVAEKFEDIQRLAGVILHYEGKTGTKKSVWAPYDTRILHHILKNKGYSKENPYPTEGLKATLEVRGAGQILFLDYYPTEIWPDEEGISFTHIERPMPARPDFAFNRVVRVRHCEDEEGAVSQRWSGDGCDFLRFYGKTMEEKVVNYAKSLVDGHPYTTNRELYAFLRKHGFTRVNRITPMSFLADEDRYRNREFIYEDEEPRSDKHFDHYLIVEKDSVVFYVLIDTVHKDKVCFTGTVEQADYHNEFDCHGNPKKR